LQYGFFRKRDLDPKVARYVAFVDLGNSKLTVSIASFTQEATKIICHRSDRNLGARDFDWAMTQKFGEEFNKKYGANPLKNARCTSRIIEAAEKARKMLSSVSDAQVNVEYLLEEEDMNRTIKIDEFLEIIAPYIERFSNVVNDCIAASGLKLDQIHSVEMMGDATRTPVILETTKKLFNKEELCRTLNSLDSIAKGAALQCAFLSPSFSAAKFTVEEINNIPIEVEYYDTGSDKKNKPSTIFGSKIKSLPWSQQMSFDNKLGNMTMMLRYAECENVLKGLPTDIAQYTVGEGKLKKADMQGHESKMEFVFENTGSHIPFLRQCSLVEKWKEEEKIPIKKPAPPKPAEEKKDEKPAEGQEAPKEEPKKEEPATVQDFETKIKSKSTAV
jgi:heat shock protein 4